MLKRKYDLEQNESHFNYINGIFVYENDRKVYEIFVFLGKQKYF